MKLTKTGGQIAVSMGIMLARDNMKLTKTGGQIAVSMGIMLEIT